MQTTSLTGTKVFRYINNAQSPAVRHKTAVLNVIVALAWNVVEWNVD